MDNKISDEEYEESLEDFSDSRLTDEEVQEILDYARKTSDVKLRRLAKEVQGWLCFLPQLLEVAKRTPEKDNQILKLARFWVRRESNIR